MDPTRHPGRQAALATVRARLEAIRAAHAEERGCLFPEPSWSEGHRASACTTCGDPTEYPVAWPCETRAQADEALAALNGMAEETADTEARR